MKRVTAYEALDGSLHHKKIDAAAASILHLGLSTDNDVRGQSIGPAEVAFVIKNRQKIENILVEIDMEDAPDVGER